MKTSLVIVAIARYPTAYPPNEKYIKQCFMRIFFQNWEYEFKKIMEYWIKSIGATRSPLDDLWLHEEKVGKGGLRSSPRLAERVHFPRNKRPIGINVGDFFLLYGVTELGGRVIGAGIFRSRFFEDDRKEELDLRSEEDIAAWPWRIDIEMLISVWHAHRGPTIDAIGMDSVKMRRRSHLRLTEEQYLAGVRALAEVALPPGT